MPVVTFDRLDLCRLIGQDVPMETLAARMPMIGGELEGVDGEAVTVEWFPDRPDLLTAEGTARALRAFMDVAPGLTPYPVDAASTELRVDPSVQAVRPHAALCFVRGVELDDRLVEQLVEAQEKLVLAPGRRRRKVAIGIHDAGALRGPFTYSVGTTPFTPLGMADEMTPAAILEQHPKGQEYGHLLAGRFPLFLDGQGQVISMPPIINAARTAVTATTRDVLVDVTGTDAGAVRAMAALVATSLAERGGRIEAVTIHDASGTWTCPDLKPREHVLHIDETRRWLGVDLDGDHVASCLRRMGHGAEAFETQVLVQTPAWRSDILHTVDLIEDVAIGHGFDAFPGRLPDHVTLAGTLPWQALEDRARSLLIGHGFHEVRTLSLSNPADQWERWGAAAPDAVRLRNPVLEEQTVLRTRLAPSLLRVLAANRHRSLPQRIFEVGYAVAGTRNRLHLCAVETGARAGFNDAKGLADALLRDLGLDATVAPADEPGFIPGRQGRILVGGSEVGVFGELHPDTVLAFGLGAATTAVAIDLAAVDDAHH